MYRFQLISVIYMFLLKFNAEEICNSKIFKPRCERNGIIIVKKAIYGRKDVDKCLSNEGEPNETNKKDPSFIGCFSDVRHIIEPQCAGKHGCDVWVVSIDVATNCHRYLKQHLKISYVCTQGNINIFNFSFS